jgi:hypothetical protein
VSRKQPETEDLFKSVVTSLFVSVPCFCAAIYLMQTHIAWEAPTVVMAAILCMGVVNFALTVSLEYMRSRLGRLTLPALMGVAAVTLMFVIAQSINDYARHLNYKWLLPAVAVCLALTGIAIFRERAFVLKLQLALNSLVLAALWGFGASGKLHMPF